ncbi:MAG: hypothetical protein IJF71_05975, partial [Clostridia bacterium]|nr:hypothetical protein [Clostridia bacterium]
TAEEQEAARALALHRFSAKTPTDSDRAELSRLEEQYKQYSLDIEAHKEVGGNSQKQAGGRSFVFSILLIVAAVLAVIGVACLAVRQTAVGVAMLALCAAAAVGALVLRHGALSGKGKASPEDALAKMEESCRQVKISLHKKLNEYGYYEAVSVLLDCERFRRDFEEYLALKARREQTLLRLSEVQDSHGALCRGLTALSARYGYGETDFSAFADQLREDVIMLTFIEKERERKHTEREEALLHVKKIADTLAEALKPYGIALSEDVRAQMQALKEDALCFESERKNAEASAKKAEDFRLQKGLTEKPQSEGGADAVSDSLEELQREIRTKETEIADKESCVEEADALQAQLDEKQQLLDYCQQRYKVLKGAEELLEKADQAITDKYISPIKDAFCAYSTALERVLGEKVSVNKDFQLSFEHAGEARSEKHFSAGQRSICALCYRLSLIDNMYADEQPFIIMDDPFVHLDAEHMQKTAELLKELSLQRQIIYFCCHESRKM